MSEPITQPAKDVPVVREADVVVAGAGVAGVFAALGAAGQGASVLLIDRFGDLVVRGVQRQMHGFETDVLQSHALGHGQGLVQGERSQRV